ncbi:hypothetical protein NCS56_01510900 [Fusarium sp. Ph1]|nr:hypothetical protein NCS56_01510900 [Fusarium sp. Ph1]
MMAPQGFKKLRVLYKLYKTKGKAIYALLDPLGQLVNVEVDDAVAIAQGLVDALLKEQRDALSPLIEDAIKLRKQCLPYFQGSTKRGHKTYIWFLKKVIADRMVSSDKFSVLSSQCERSTSISRSGRSSTSSLNQATDPH